MRNLYWGVILIGIGILLLLDNLGVADFGDMIHDFWPVLLILWGLSVLLRRRAAGNAQRMGGYTQPQGARSQAPGPSSQVADASFEESPGSPQSSGSAFESADASSQTMGAPSAPLGGPTHTMGGQFQTESELIHQSSVFGDISVKVSSRRFRGGSISTVFGSTSLDLSSAGFAEGDHELRIHGVFGESRLILPRDAAVAISASSVLGDLVIFGQQKGGISSEIQHMTPSYALASSKLRISITRIFGSIRVD